MTTAVLPEPTLHLNGTEARQFLIAHQRLWPPRRLAGTDGILEFIGHVGCIQYDPIAVAGGNPNLVLQSRVAGYRPDWLDRLLYVERRLWDGWDKVASIYLASAWPCFGRRRARMRQVHAERDGPDPQILGGVLEAVRELGPLSAIDLKHDAHNQRMDGWWGVPVRLGRVALEVLYDRGELGVHHRVGTRRYFDLVERLLPDDLLAAPDPNPALDEYHDWHVLRRVGALGLAPGNAPEYWLGILGVKSPERRAILARLVDRGDLQVVAVGEVPRRTFFLRTSDLPTLDAVRSTTAPLPQAAILAPLDNLMWDRTLLRDLFDFEYVWEVYKPAARRRYGYYVLPILYGDRFIARFDPAMDKETGDLILETWWWEAGIEPDRTMAQALIDCFQAFAAYLGAPRVRRGAGPAASPTLAWVDAVEQSG